MPRVLIKCNRKTKLRLEEILKNTVECPFEPRPIIGCKGNGRCAQCLSNNVKYIVSE